MYAFHSTQSKYYCLYSRERVFKFHVEFLLSLRPSSPSFFFYEYCETDATGLGKDLLVSQNNNSRGLNPVLADMSLRMPLMMLAVQLK